MTTALDRVLPVLRCPVCSDTFAREERTLVCAASHRFDLARQGFVTLLAGARPHAGDTAAMVADRERFLTAGHYSPIAATVAAAVSDAPPGLLLDLAAGTGWYAARALDAEADRDGLAVDVSVAALRRAARIHPRLAAVGADAWGRLPVAEGSVSVALSVFGPREPRELQRVLVAGGLVVAVTPTGNHLAEVREPLGLLDIATGKVSALVERFDGFTVQRFDAVEYSVSLDRPALAALAGMGPAAFHAAPGELAARAERLPSAVEVTVSVEVTTLRR